MSYSSLMENFINSMPKPVLALLILGGAIVFFLFAQPMHTICDTQIEALRHTQNGKIFPATVKVKTKNQKIPPKLAQAKETCQLGNSAGSCFEYFNLLKELAVDIGNGASECTTQLFEVAEVNRALVDGVEVMARIAWGAQTPELSWNRSGWMQESELAIYCRIKNIYVRAQGQEAWVSLQRSIMLKLPGEPMPIETDPNKAVAEPKKALQMMKEEEVFSRSIFAVRCEAYR